MARNIRLRFVIAASFIVVLSKCQMNDLRDFDEVETYTRILLHTKNGSLLGGPRSDGGPLIIDYPFPIHHYMPPQHSEFPLRPANNFQGAQQYSSAGGHTHEGIIAPYGHLGAGIGHTLSTLSHLYPHKKKKKKFYKKKSKFIIPLLITFIAKISTLLPTLKLTLLALFSLLLFAKKAFLVSVGTLLIVLYEHFTSKSNNNQSAGINLWKDRGQALPGAHDVHSGYSDITKVGDNKAGADWWHLEGPNGTKISPREVDKWKRWWAPQVKSPQYFVHQQHPPQLEESASLKERIKNNLKLLFGRADNET